VEDHEVVYEMVMSMPARMGWKMIKFDDAAVSLTFYMKNFSSTPREFQEFSRRFDTRCAI
jgi:hypothetical protein